MHVSELILEFPCFAFGDAGERSQGLALIAFFFQCVYYFIQIESIF